MVQELPTKPPRHRGALRIALIDAGLSILAADGLSALSLRACAARAGVSHAAPAHHFAGLPGLLTAIAARGYVIFTQTMIHDRDAAPDTPRDALIGICRGYLRFARENPGLFTLMFNHVYQKVDDPDFDINSEPAFAVLAQACAPFEPVSDAPGSTEMMVWTQVHGLACLLQSQRLGPPQLNLASVEFTDILPELKLR
ncbi:MAG: TetR/AcrR family transcriptional regulator [Rhodobacteraceae bacterium]|nr:TetR/AcrR family transcriptional regulator [Paracoccaceae bacterium]